MRLTVFTTAHPLDDVRVYSKFAESFRAMGATISWIGPGKSAFSGDRYRADFVKYSVYRSRDGKIARLLSIPRSAFRLALHPNADWLYCPDPDAAVLAVLLRPFHRAKIIFDVHEEYHGDLLSRWLGERAGAVFSRLLVRALRFAASRVDILVGVNEPVLAPYTDVAKRTLILRNSAPDWFSEQSTPVSKPAFPLRLFHGKAAATNGTVPILNALSKRPSPIEVVMMPSPGKEGNPPYIERFFEHAIRPGVKGKLVLSNPVPHAEMPDLMDTCQVGMIGYGRELGRASLPNRLFEYMARGLAIMAPSYSPLIAEIIEKDEIGITRDFEDPQDIADGMAWFQEHPEETKAMGVRARQAFINEYSWDSDFKKLEALIR